MALSLTTPFDHSYRFDRRGASMTQLSKDLIFALCNLWNGLFDSIDLILFAPWCSNQADDVARDTAL
jgi:hypothetical protein